MYRTRRPNRRSISRRTLVARTHLHTVDVPIPPDGLGSRIHDFYGWCDGHLDPEKWAAFHHSIERAGTASADQLRFFFLDAGDARRFALTFNLVDQLATPSPSGASD